MSPFGRRRNVPFRKGVDPARGMLCSRQNGITPFLQVSKNIKPAGSGGSVPGGCERYCISSKFRMSFFGACFTSSSRVSS